ncbi:MAG: hypothetical protein M3Q99_14165 [Acidobacteriota bacterium]|nr:hypothetical protein [Acidobacteriota bacterium]
MSIDAFGSIQPVTRPALAPRPTRNRFSGDQRLLESDGRNRNLEHI